MTSRTLKRYSGHLGAIFFNISILGILLVTGSIMVPLTWLAIFICISGLLIVSTIITIGTIWLSESYRSFMSWAYGLLLSDKMSTAIQFLFDNILYFLSGTGILLVLSTVFLFLDRANEKSKIKLYINYALIAIFLVFLVVIIILIVRSKTI